MFWAPLPLLYPRRCRDIIMKKNGTLGVVPLDVRTRATEVHSETYTTSAE